MKQQSLASQGVFEKYGRKSRRELFLEEMERVVPWSALESLVRPHYAKAGNGRQPVGLSIMLRTYFVQQWFNLSDPGVEEALYESAALRRFVGVDLGMAPAPDETTICRFRHLLEKHDLGDLLHGEERKVWGDGGYQGQTEAIHEAAPHAQDMTCRRTKFKNYVDEEAKRKNTTKSKVRAKVEHVFRILKRVFGFDRVRYRGIAKNHHRLCANFALINLYLHRKRLAVLGA